MNGTMIASTMRGNMHPLAYQGVLATDCYHQVASILRSRLGDGHVLLFAEPVFDPGRDIVDWYSPVQGTPVKMVDLPVEKQEQVRAILVKMAADILTQTQHLKNTGDSNRVMAGHILELALQYPSEDCIYLVGEQPVLVCWGFGPPTSGAKPQDLSRLGMAAPRPTPPSPPPTEPTPRAAVPAAPPVVAAASVGPRAAPSRPATPVGGWLLWLCLLLALLALLGLLWFFWGDLTSRWQAFFPASVPVATAPGASSGDLEAALARGKQLQAERDALLATLTEKAGQCPQTPAPTPATPVRPNELRVPDTAAPGSSLGFLQGVWRCDSDLSTPKDPVIVEYIFDAEGKGQITVKTAKKLCTAGARASLGQSGSLLIESDATIPCSQGSPIEGQRVECVGKGDRTVCEGLNTASKGKWNARFSKF